MCAEGGDVVYEFGGSDGAVIPAETLPHNLTRTFTISTWMRHNQTTNRMDKVSQCTNFVALNPMIILSSFPSCYLLIFL